MAVEKARYAASVYLTPADLSQYPGPSTSTRYAFVKSLGESFYWAIGDTSTADNVRVISHSGGTPGRWKRASHGRLDEIHISVKDYGALVDGTTNDAAAFTAAIAAVASAGKGSIFIPGGTMLVGSKVTLTADNILIYGVPGATTIKANATEFDWILEGTGRSKVTLRDLIVDVNKAARGAAVGTIGGIRIVSSTDITVERVTVQNTLGTAALTAVGIQLDGTRITTDQTKVLDCGNSGKISDGLYIAGTDITVTDHTANACLDHGLVLERANKFTVKGVRATDCGGGIAVGTFSTGDFGDGTIDGFVIGGTSASISVGISLGLFGSPLGTGFLKNVRFCNGQIDNTTSSGFAAVNCYPQSLPASGVTDVTGATNASPIVITATSHGYIDNQTVTVWGVRGNRAANGQFKAKNVTANTFELFTLADVAVAGTGAFVAGGGFTHAWGRTQGITFENVNISGGPTQALNISLADNVQVVGGHFRSAAETIKLQKKCTGFRMGGGAVVRPTGAHSILVEDGCQDVEIDSSVSVDGKDGVTTWAFYALGTCYDIRCAKIKVSGSSLLDPEGIGADTTTTPRSIHDFFFRSAVPASSTLGRWEVGQIIIDTAATATSRLGWQVTTAGVAGAGAVFTELKFIRVGDSNHDEVSDFVDVTQTQTVAGAKTWSNDARFSGFVGVNQAPPTKAKLSATAAANDAALAVVSSSGTGAVVFDPTGNYGFIDYDLNSANGIRVSALGPVRIGVNTNATYGSSTFTERIRANSTGLGFFGSVAIAKPTITGSRGGNAALASLLTELANYGLITDSTS